MLMFNRFITTFCAFFLPLFCRTGVPLKTDYNEGKRTAEGMQCFFSFSMFTYTIITTGQENKCCIIRP